MFSSRSTEHFSRYCDADSYPHRLARTVALQHLAWQNPSPLAKSCLGGNKTISIKCNFMTIPKHGGRIRGLGECSRRVGDEIKPCLYRLYGIARQRSINNGLKSGKWGPCRRHDDRRGLRPNLGHCMGVTPCQCLACWSVFGSAHRVISLLHPSPHGRYSALAARDGRQRDSSRTACNWRRHGQVGAEPVETE